MLPRRFDLNAALIGALSIFTLVHLIWILFRLPLPLQIDPNEAWNAWHAASAMGTSAGGARPLYPSGNELILNNYPPLSFYIVGVLGSLIGDNILAGRILSLLSTIAIGGCVAILIVRLGGAPLGAVLGALFWLSSMFRFAADYVGANDPALLGLAVMMTGLTWYVAQVERDRSILLPLVLIVCAGFIKHNLIVLPLAAFYWHASRRGILPAARAAFGGGVLAAMMLWACHVLYGADFIANLTLPREIRLMRVVEHLNRLQFIAAGVVVWGVWAQARPRGPAVAFTAVWLALGFASYGLQKMSPGVGINALFEMWIGAAVGFGLAVPVLVQRAVTEGLGARVALALISAAVLARLLADPNVEPYRVGSAAFRNQIRERVVAMADEIEVVRRITTPVMCSVPTVCYRAGKPFIYDNYATTTRLKTGHLSIARLAELLAPMQLLVRYSDPKVTWSRSTRPAGTVGVTLPLGPPKSR